MCDENKANGKRLLNNLSDLRKMTEKRSSSWIEYSPVCTKIVDLDFNLQYMSAAGIKALKIDDITQLYGKPYPFDFYPEPFRNLMAKNLDKAKKTGDVITQEASVVDIEGNKIWYNSTLVPVNDDKGRIDYIMIVSIDTTERHKAIQEIKNLNETLGKSVAERTSELVKTNEKLEMEINERTKAETERDRLFNKSIDMLCIAGFDGNFKQLNPAWTFTLGWSIDELLSRPWSSFVHPDDQQSTIEAGERLQHGKSVVEFENRYQCRDGTYRWISWNSFPILEEKQIFAVARDITERKQTEEKLKDSLEQSRVWLDNSPVCTKVVDLDFNLQYMSAAGINALKIDDVTKLYGKPYPFDFFPEPFKISMNKNLEKAKETGEIITEEAPVSDIDGNELWFRATIVPVRDDEGRIDFIIIVSVDINERKKMEEELIKMQKIESVGVLAGGIAHDFNNYLQGILSNNALVSARTDVNSESYEYLAETRKAVIQAMGLTQQLLTFSKGGNPVKKTISISKLIMDTARFTQSGSNVRCEIDIPNDLWQIDADKEQIRQVISNLLINADQAMPGGGTVKLKAENFKNHTNELSILNKEKYVKLTVKDQGIGIPQDKLQKIFDPYFTTKQKGSGLGLAITYSIIKKHGGNITVDSEMGVGTTFYIYIPVSVDEISGEPFPGKAESSRPELAEGKGDDVTSLAGKKILFMDDEAIIKLAVVRQLKSLQYEVEGANDGTEAVGLYRKAFESGKPFDAVILDLTVTNGMGGKETIKELHNIDIDVKAIVASGYSNDPIMTNFGKYGFKDMVKKPYEICDLEEVLQKVIMDKEESSPH